MRFFDAGVQGKRLKKRIRPFVLDSAPNGDTPPLVQTMHHWCDETGAVRFFEKVAPVRCGARRDCTSGAGKILKFFFFYGVGASQGHYYLIPVRSLASHQITESSHFLPVRGDFQFDLDHPYSSSTACNVRG